MHWVTGREIPGLFTPVRKLQSPLDLICMRLDVDQHNCRETMQTTPDTPLHS